MTGKAERTESDEKSRNDSFNLFYRTGEHLDGQLLPVQHREEGEQEGQHLDGS